MLGSPERRVSVPATEKSMMSAPALALASVMAWRREPAPLLLVLLTV